MVPSEDIVISGGQSQEVADGKCFEVAPYDESILSLGAITPAPINRQRCPSADAHRLPGVAWQFLKIRVIKLIHRTRSSPKLHESPMANQSPNPSPTNDATVLVIEDDPSVSQLMQLYLLHDGYNVLEAKDGETGLQLATERSPSLILLDLNLPKMDGIDICRRVRQTSDVPIIMVTARVEEEDRLDGLDLGADDYVSKPFSPRELMARVRAVLRRTRSENEMKASHGGNIEVGAYNVDLDARTVAVNERELHLTPTEYRLLVYFINSNRRTVSREQIIDGAIGYTFAGFERTVDTHISNLRRKLERANDGERHLKTVYGVGYRFEAA